MKNLVSIFFAILVLGCVSRAQEQPKADSIKVAGIGLMDMPGAIEFAGEAVPLGLRDVRESLQREMAVTSFMHSRTLQSLLVADRQMALITPTLAAENIPYDFVYLCMAESGFNPEAISSAGAAGLWQLMPETARQNGLIVNKDIDERFHPEKATKAATKYLKRAYAEFGSWTMAAASYNLGVAGVSSRKAKQDVESYYDMFFPEETLRYMYRILSLKLLMADPEKYGFDTPPEVRYKPFEGYTTVKVSGKPIDWSKVAHQNGTNYKILRELNPWIRTYEYKNDPGQTFTVKIPSSSHRD